jgi:integrase
MQNLIRRGATFYGRLFIPQDRWADVGKAMGAAGGVKREVVRTLQTTDRIEAKRRLGAALAAIQAQVEERLAAARLKPLTDWTADWAPRAAELRALVQAAGDTPLDGTHFGDTERDMILGDRRRDAILMEDTRGEAQAEVFWAAVTATETNLREAADAWLLELGRSRKRKTIEGHQRVFADLEQFLRERHNILSLTTATLADVTRRMAGDFITARSGQVSAAAVKREASAPMGLWRWAIRRGHTDDNPWADQTSGLAVVSGDDKPGSKRAFTPAELGTLLRATGADWAPNRGGYGATLWDATRLALLTGLRAAELADLRIRDLIQDGAAISVTRGKTKNARRVVPLPQVARAVIAARLADLPDTTPDAPLWPELPVLLLTDSRGGKLSDRFGTARRRLLPGAVGVDMHSLRRSYATLLEAAMHAGGRVNPTLISTLMGQTRGTMALDLYSSGASLPALSDAVADMEAMGLPEVVLKALAETAAERPSMARYAPRPSPEDRPARASKRLQRHPVVAS